MQRRLPEWFKKKTPDPGTMSGMKGLLDRLELHTVCQSALCPHIGECFSKKTATFMILGNSCTRNCTFCAVNKGKALPVDEDEPRHVNEAIERLGLNYVVITSVTRDDLPDGGASHFASVISEIHRKRNDITVEVLVPDFLGSVEALKTLVAAAPQVISHNIETVPRFYPLVRAKADYNRSVELLYRVKQLNSEIITKSGIMLGLGETQDEVIEVMQDLREAGCDLLTIGQYLQPSPRHFPVSRFVPPEEFARYIGIGKDLGFKGVASAPLVRSSFEAAELYSK